MRRRFVGDGCGDSRGRVCAAAREFNVLLGERRFVYQRVGVARQLDCAFAVSGVGAVSEDAPALVLFAKLRGINRAPIGERHAFAALETPEQRTFGNADFAREFDEKATAPVTFAHAITEGRNAMTERATLDRKLVVLENRAGFDFVYAYAVGIVCVVVRRLATSAQESFETGGTVDVNFAARAAEFAAREQAGQAVKVIAVKVCDEDAANLRDAQGASENLMLRAFTAIEQPKVRPLRQTQSDRRNVARSRRDACAGS